MDQADKLKAIIDEVWKSQYGEDVVAGRIARIRERIKLLIKSVWAESSYIQQVDDVEFEKVNARNWYEQHANFTKAKAELIDLIKVIIDDMETQASSTLPKKRDGKAVTKFDHDKVFIVHGHDSLAKTEVARFIGELGFTPIILHEQPSEGKTVIEKIEAHSNVGFGIVLYTPCDVGAVKELANELHPRARQNVVFEHGYLIAKLGRSKVCALVKEEVETPTDIDGVVYIQMDSHQAWRMEIVREMLAAGFEVDMKNL